MVSKFDLEKPRVALLMQRLGLRVDEYEDPNAKGRADESGADVVVKCNDRRIDIQVTDLDTGEELGQARKVEKRLQRDAASRDSIYLAWGQNDPAKVVAAIDRSISRKARMSFVGFDHFWLLLCCGVPEPGAIASTFVMTPWLDTCALDRATLDKLSGSKYSRALIHAILGAEEKALYQWERGSCWGKSTVPVPLEEQGLDFWHYKNNPELLSDPEAWCKQEIEKILGRKIDFPPSVQYSERRHIVHWIDRATGETRTFPAAGSALSIDEWHAMIFACSVVKSSRRRSMQSITVLSADGQGPAGLLTVKEEHQAHGRKGPCADRPSGYLAGDHKAGGSVEPGAPGMGQLI
jgi:hypothetical protein